jgi:uncharacterized protein (DUF2236 family)
VKERRFATPAGTAPAPVMAHRINREAIVVLGWGRAILLQIAHPLVAAGVAEHSDFRGGVAGYARRTHRTVGAMLRLTFGTEREARQTADRINAIHDRVHGTLREPAGVFPAGTRYSARDPELLRWVHATLLDTLPLTYDLFVAPLTREHKDRYCAEAAAVGPLLGIPDALLPRSVSEVDTYLEQMFASGQIHVSGTARMLAQHLLAPPLGLAGLPLAGLLRLVTVGLLPPSIRAGYGFEWSDREARRFHRAVRWLRRIRWLLPALLREWPAARRTRHVQTGRG